MLRHVSALTVSHLQAASLACAAFVSTFMLEIPHVIKIIVIVIECYNQYYSSNTVQNYFSFDIIDAPKYLQFILASSEISSGI